MKIIQSYFFALPKAQQRFCLDVAAWLACMVFSGLGFFVGPRFFGGSDTLSVIGAISIAMFFVAGVIDVVIRQDLICENCEKK